MVKPTRYYSKKQETRVATLVGGKRQSNSGATTFDKGDVVDRYMLFECKTATKPMKSFSIKKDWFLKNKKEALSIGKEFGAVVFDFGSTEDFVALSMNDFLNLYSAWKDSVQVKGDD